MQVYLEYTDAFTTYANLASPEFLSRLLNGAGLPVYRLSITQADIHTLVLYTGRLNTVDVTPPVITLTGSPSVRVAQFDNYTDLGATARDDLDMDIPSWKMIVRNMPVNTSVTGSTVIFYDVFDYYGNAAATVNRTVTVRPEVTRASRQTAARGAAGGGATARRLS